MGTLQIRLFGTLSLERDGQPLPRFPSRRVKDLLSYLLLNRDTLHSREYLSGLFWGEREDRQARHCLNTTLWRLHGVLGQSEVHGHPYLRIDSQNLGFNTASDVRLDVAEFETRCSWAEQIGEQSPEQQAVLYRQAVTLYQADLLTDCYEDWCLVERERLQCLYLRALGHLLTYHAARSEHQAAIDYARRILACDPLREEVQRDLIRLYLATQQPAVALRQYRACEAILQRELGIEPMPETQTLLAQIVDFSGPATLVDGHPVGDRSPASVPGADPAQDLTTALSRIQEAGALFDRARTQLQEATALVEAVASRLGSAATPRRAEPHPGKEMAPSQLQDAARLVAEVVQHLELLPGSSSGRKPVSTAR